MTKTTRVMVVDAHPVFRHGLTTFINMTENLHLVGQAPNGVEALLLCETENPDVILIDLAQPERNGIASIRLIHAKCPDIHIIALATRVDDELVRATFLAGATGYLLKTTALDELARAIHTARTGVPVFSAEVAHLLIHSFTNEIVPGEPLTKREREVLALMVDGYSNGKIAIRLGVGRETVKTHISHILSKLGVKNRVDAIILALQKSQLPLID